MSYTGIPNEAFKLIETSVLGGFQKKAKAFSLFQSTGQVQDRTGGSYQAVQTYTSSEVGDATVTTNVSNAVSSPTERVGFNDNVAASLTVSKQVTYTQDEINQYGSMDTTAVEQAGISVARKVEEIILKGHNLNNAGASFHGLTTSTNRIPFTIGDTWATAGTEAVRNDVIGMLSSLKNNGVQADSCTLLVSNNYWQPLQAFSGVADLGNKSRQMVLNDIAGIDDIQFLWGMTDNTVLLVPKDSTIYKIFLTQAPTIDTEMGRFEKSYNILYSMSIAPVVYGSGEGTGGLVHATA